MGQFNLFHLPAELVLQVVEHLPAADLASFLRASKTSWRFAIRTAERYPIRKILIQFKQASIDNNAERMLALLPIIRHINNKRIPAVGYEALIQSCMGPSGEAVLLLVNDGVPYAGPRGPLHDGDHGVLLDFVARGVWRTNDFHGAVACPPHVHAQWALKLAVEYSNTAMVERLLAERGYGVDVNYNYTYKDGGSGPVLLCAAKKENDYIVKVLLRYGGDIHARHPRNGWSALHFAAAKGHDNVAEALLEAGADVNYAEPVLGHTPLLLAVGHSRDETLGVLIQRGARINHQNKLGRSALSIAAAVDDPDVVSTLLDYGVDVRQVCCKGRTALSYAIGRNSRGSVGMLADAMSVSVNEHALSMGPLDYTTRRFYKRVNEHRDADVLELASVLGNELTGDARRDAHRLECEPEAYVDFNIFDAPLESDDEDEDDELDSNEDKDGMDTDNDSQA
ncbi:ankyrin repeat-containing domain protein [Aspergillus germanicus]